MLPYSRFTSIVIPQHIVFRQRFTPQFIVFCANYTNLINIQKRGLQTLNMPIFLAFSMLCVIDIIPFAKNISILTYFWKIKKTSTIFVEVKLYGYFFIILLNFSGNFPCLLFKVVIVMKNDFIKPIFAIVNPVSVASKQIFFWNIITL